MSLFARRPRPQQRQQGLDPRPLSDTFLSLFGRSYQDVDLSNAENSLQVISIRAAVDLLSSIASELPVAVYSGEGVERKKRPIPGYLQDPGGDGYGLEDWIVQACVSWMLRGNLYGKVLERGSGDTLRTVQLFHPDTVSIRLEEGVPVWSVTGEVVPQAAFLHRRVNPIPGRILGLSPVSAHADSIGLSIAATRFGGDWFKAGGHPGGILSNSEVDLSNPAVAQTAKDRFMAALRGNREPVVLGKGWKFDQVQVAPEESQFLETQQYTSAECARIYGPGVPEVLGYQTSSMQYANIVDRDLSLLKYSANKWLKRVERLLSQFLPRPQYVVLDRDAFLETNALQRWQVHQLALTTKARTINEVREKENDPPVPWGDEPYEPPAAAPPGENDGPPANEETE